MGLFNKIKHKFIPNQNPFEKAVKKVNHQNFTFIQIGACDGKSFDPIFKLIQKYHWTGVLVEPIPFYFKQLQENYKGIQNLTFVNKAISDKNGISNMYTIDPAGFEELPEWVKGISSLSTDRNALDEAYWTTGRGKVHRDKGYSYETLKKYIKEIPIECITVDQLLQGAGIQHFDLLQIDAEGHDYVILKQFDLNKYRPKIIHFEFANLSDEEKSKATLKLKQAGYQLDFYNPNDLLAILTD